MNCEFYKKVFKEEKMDFVFPMDLLKMIKKEKS